MFFKY